MASSSRRRNSRCRSCSSSTFPALLLLVLMSTMIVIQFPVAAHGRPTPAALMNAGVMVQEEQGALNAAALSNKGSPVQSRAAAKQAPAAASADVDEDEDMTAANSSSLKHEQVNDYLPLEQVFSLERRSLGGPGSSPPQCTAKCGRCYPCKPVHVPIQPGLVKTAEYYPEAWRCKCGNKLFMP